MVLRAAFLIGGLLLASAAPRAEISPEDAVKAAVEKGDVEAAVAALRSAVSSLETVAQTDASGAAQRLDDLAGLILPLSPDAARTAAETARGWRERAFTPAGKEVAKSWALLATIDYTTGAWGAAESSARKAVTIDRTADNLETLAVLLMKQGRLADAEPFFTDTIAMRRAAEPPEPAKLAESLNAYAELQRMRDRADAAAKTFDEAIGIATPLAGDDPLLLARLETNRAGLAKDRGRLGEAEEGVRRSIALKEKAAAAGLPPDLSIGWLNLAEMYRLEGNFEAAEPLYRKSLELARQELGPDHPELAIHMSQLAVLERDTGRLGEAERAFGEAAAHLERTIGPDHPLLAQTLVDLAEVEIARGRAEEGIKQAERALAIRKKALGADHSDTAASLVTLARAEKARGAEGDAARALAHVDEALAILRASGNYPETAIDALSVRATLDRAAGRPPDAARDLGEAIGLVESLRPASGGGEATRAAFLGKYGDLYERLVALEAARGQVREAFAVAERGRGRALLDLLASARVDLLAGIPEPRRTELAARASATRAEVAEWQARAAAARERTDLEAGERRTAVAEADRELARASAAFRLAHEEIRNASALWRGASGGAPIDLDTARREVLGERELLLSYAIGPEESWLLVVPKEPAPVQAFALTVTGSDAAHFGIPAGPLTASALDDALFGIAGIVPAISAPPVAGEGAAEGLSLLYRMLVPEAAQKAIAGAREIVLVPDGSLFRLPFEALVVAKDRYWLDEMPPVRYAVSATVLRELARRPVEGMPRTPDTLSVSNPAYGRGGSTRWSPLPKTVLESDALAQVRPITLLAGETADEPGVRSAIGGRRFLHLATHGVVDRGRGELFAALVLAPPPGPVNRADDDGYLSLYEIYELDLSSDLAVLSACSSGTGSGVPGEGAFALTRAFQAAGAKRTIGTLWSVEDEASARLIAATFRGIGKKKPYATALRDAKRGVRADARTASPFFWAPFVLSGVR